MGSLLCEAHLRHHVQLFCPSSMQFHSLLLGLDRDRALAFLLALQWISLDSSISLCRNQGKEGVLCLLCLQKILFLLQKLPQGVLRLNQNWKRRNIPLISGHLCHLHKDSTHGPALFLGSRPTRGVQHWIGITLILNLVCGMCQGYNQIEGCLHARWNYAIKLRCAPM